MVEAGDRVEVDARKVGQERRRGEVTGVRGPLVEVRWDNGGQTAFVPAAGSLTVLAPSGERREG
jgi:uncharacterized protein DUF1918